METELQKLRARIEEEQQKIEQIYQSVEKLRRYFLWTMIITIAVIVLPLIAMIFILPSFLGNYLGQINSLGGF